MGVFDDDLHGRCRHTGKSISDGALFFLLLFFYQINPPAPLPIGGSFDSMNPPFLFLTAHCVGGHLFFLMLGFFVENFGFFFVSTSLNLVEVGKTEKNTITTQ